MDANICICIHTCTYSYTYTNVFTYLVAPPSTYQKHVAFARFWSLYYCFLSLSLSLPVPLSLSLSGWLGGGPPLSLSLYKYGKGVDTETL